MQPNDLPDQFTIKQINALKDNYIWAIIDKKNHTTIIVDPGEAEPVDEFLKKEALSLKAIFITHHHFDHTNGVKTLAEQFKIPVLGPATEAIAALTKTLHEKDEVCIESCPLPFQILTMPGHTLGHIAYYSPHILFCGDTLFAGGCGRIFEGTAEQMYASLQKIAHLPNETLIYCAHEYTLANLEFAKKVEPDNLEIIKRIEEVKALREKNLPSLPSLLKIEKETNPFLRCDSPQIKMQVENFAGKTLDTPLEVFTCLRKWKGW